jgi:hypothetical protein
MSLVLYLGLFTSAHAQPAGTGVALDASETVFDPDSAPSKFTLDTVIVDSQNNRVLIRYDVETPEGEVRRSQLALFSLDSDRSIHYKMGMLMLLREAITDDSLRVFIGIKPGTENLSLKTVSSIAVQRIR